MKTLLITGVAGFIGSNAVSYFKARGLRVIGLDAQPPSSKRTPPLDRYERMALPDARLNALLNEEKPDFCLHCAGGSSVSSSVLRPAEDFSSHVPVTYAVLSALREEAPACKLIYISSAAVYGNPKTLPIKETAPLEPISPYGYHKLSSELICEEFNRLYGMPVASVRLFSAYGAGLRKQLLWDIYEKAQASDSVELHGTGRETRDFIYISDIIRAFDIIFEQGDFNGEVYNLAGGREASVQTVAQLMIDSLSLSRSVVFRGDVRAGDPPNWLADVTRIKKLGFAPEISLEEGVKKFAKWCNEQAKRGSRLAPPLLC